MHFPGEPTHPSQGHDFQEVMRKNSQSCDSRGFWWVSEAHLGIYPFEDLGL